MDSVIKTPFLVRELMKLSIKDGGNNLIPEMSKTAGLRSENELYPIYITPTASLNQSERLDFEQNLCSCQNDTSNHNQHLKSLHSISSSFIFSRNDATSTEKALCEKYFNKELFIRHTPCIIKRTPSFPRIKEIRRDIYKSRKRRFLSTLKKLQTNFKNFSSNF